MSSTSDTEELRKGKSGLLLKIALPVIIGIAVVVWLFSREFNMDALHEIRVTPVTVAAIAAAVAAVGVRDFGMAWRFRSLTDRDLGWGATWRTTFLCEFTSAITPSSVGGSALSMIFLKREGVNIGRATTLTMTILFLDELFFVIFCPVIALVVSHQSLFDIGSSKINGGMEVAFWIVYGVIAALTTVLFLGIFIVPRAVKRLLDKLFSYRLLSRWHEDAVNVGENMIATSRAIKRYRLRWWLEAFAATCVSWIGRYLVVNALFWGFVPGADQLVVFGRQFVVWSLLMFTPTPGGSGVSEWLFKEYYGDLIGAGGVVMVVAILWRILTYYIYLFIGFLLLPTLFKKR